MNVLFETRTRRLAKAAGIACTLLIAISVLPGCSCSSEDPMGNRNESAKNEDATSSLDARGVEPADGLAGSTQAPSYTEKRDAIPSSTEDVVIDPETGVLTEESYNKIKEQIESGLGVDPIAEEEYEKSRSFFEEEQDVNVFDDSAVFEAHSTPEQANGATWEFLRNLSVPDGASGMIDMDRIVNEPNNLVKLKAEGAQFASQQSKELVFLSTPKEIDSDAIYTTYEIWAIYQFEDGTRTKTDYTIKMTDGGIASLVADT